MQIHSNIQQDILILSLTGRLDSNTADTLNQPLLEHIATGQQKIILDFQALDYISSAGLRVILMAAKRMQANKGHFILCELKPLVREVFEISGFLKILTVVNRQTDALAKLD